MPIVSQALDELGTLNFDYEAQHWATQLAADAMVTPNKIQYA
ncbi:hypothetical protein [Oceanimonas smirnovii]|nr:hypothetical protein [Oceanimonas smirnovii]